MVPTRTTCGVEPTGVAGRPRRIGRLRDLLASIHPGLERVVDPTQKASLVLLSRYVTPAEIRRAGTGRLVNHMLRGGRLPRPHVETLAEQALAAAKLQPAGYRYGGPAFPGGIVLGIGLGILLDDFWAWLLIRIGAGFILMAFVAAIGK